MATSVVYLWCEYDFGGCLPHNAGIYSTMELAVKAINDFCESEFDPEDEVDFAGLEEEGLLGWEWITYE